MSEILKKPYEISVWEDELVTLENGESYYKEKKLAIIGSNVTREELMTSNDIAATETGVTIVDIKLNEGVTAKVKVFVVAK